jgi:hypothetical protein
LSGTGRPPGELGPLVGQGVDRGTVRHSNESAPYLRFTTQVNFAVPRAPDKSFAVTVTAKCPAFVGFPVAQPDGESRSPGGSPEADHLSVWPAAESVALSCRCTAAPTFEVCVPGFVTVTLFGAALTVHPNVVVPVTPVVSVALIVTALWTLG